MALLLTAAELEFAPPSRCTAAPPDTKLSRAAATVKALDEDDDTNAPENDVDTWPENAVAEVTILADDAAAVKAVPEARLLSASREAS